MLSPERYVACACGNRHWGAYGAAGLLLLSPARGVLLQRRPWWVHHGDTWSLPGGALRANETPEQAALREAAEETGLTSAAVRVLASSVADHGTWAYTTVLATTGSSPRTRASGESA